MEDEQPLILACGQVVQAQSRSGYLNIYTGGLVEKTNAGLNVLDSGLKIEVQRHPPLGQKGVVNQE